MRENETTHLVMSHLVVRGAELRVVDGPDRGTVRRIDRPTFTVGKGSAASLRLADEAVSREHLRFELGPTGLTLHDGGSKNGTWIGPLRIDRALLTSDATIRLGVTSIEVRLDAETSQLDIAKTTQFGDAIGHSPAMRHVFGLLGRAAETDVSVLLEGESGVGKDVLARAIHGASRRAAGPFVPVDCGAIPAQLIESELFGHERGAFTGADRPRDGLFREADGGTIFLDELGELPIEMQPKLLRILEQREVRPVGGNKAARVDVRVVAATNRVLGDEIAKGTFREDLFYRVAMVRVRVPPLRERSEDVLALATMFLRKSLGQAAAELAPDFASMLKTYGWPGNVRELHNVVGRYALLGARARAELFDRETMAAAQGSTSSSFFDDLAQLHYYDARKLVLDRFEQTYFPAVMARAGDVIARAAEIAGMPRTSFYRMMERRGDGGSEG